MKDMFSVGLRGCGDGPIKAPSNNFASAPVLAYEAPTAAPLFSGSAAGGYVPPDSGDGPLLS